jgi:hypothetical protein
VTAAQVNLYYPPEPGRTRPKVVTIEVTSKGRLNLHKFDAKMQAQLEGYLVAVGILQKGQTLSAQEPAAGNGCSQFVIGLRGLINDDARCLGPGLPVCSRAARRCCAPRCRRARYLLCPLLGKAVRPTDAGSVFSCSAPTASSIGRRSGVTAGAAMCRCPDCGQVPVEADRRAALALDEDWLRQKMRLALGIESRDGIDDLGRRCLAARRCSPFARRCWPAT